MSGLLMPFGASTYGFYGFLFLPLMVWSLAWKGMALWRAARTGSQGWFVALLIINTMGILEILYLYVITKKTDSTPTTPTTPPVATPPAAS